MMKMKENSETTIMIVDDTPANLNLLVDLLLEKEYRVLAFPGGAPALAAAKERPPDLILLDIRMPEMDGFEVCRRLKKNETLQDIPILFISALTDIEDKLQAFALGGADYISKPIQAEEVYARVRTHLNNRLLQQQMHRYNQELERTVAERTQELSRANQRLRHVSQLKDDFFRMITYEVRVPANGVLGVGRLLADLCPPSDTRTLYEDLFEESSNRLLNLLDDATLLIDLHQLIKEPAPKISLSRLLEEVRCSLPMILMLWNDQPVPDSFLIRGEPSLLKKALVTAFQLAACFCRDQCTVPLTGSIQGNQLTLTLMLDRLHLNQNDASDFFRIESPVRSSSFAEKLGLSPVVAHAIIKAFGGTMRLIKNQGDTGVLELGLLG